MNFLNIAGGVMLILLGMRYLRKGLDRLFGNRLLDWLQGITASRWKGFLAGMVAGAMAPSSTSIALLSVQMLSRAAVPAGRMLAVVLGANVGLTITVQLLSFHLEDSAAALIVMGGVAFLYFRRPLFRGGGQILLAFGLIFLAMQLIGGGARGIAASGDLVTIFRISEKSPWALVAGATVLTVCMQSSTAAIGLGLGLAQGGLFGPSALVPWVLGANLGIATTVLAAGWTSLEGRRLGTGSLILKIAGAVVVLLALPVLAGRIGPVERWPVGRLTADFHTGFNLVLGLVALPFLGPIASLINALVQAGPEDEQGSESYLDPLLLQSPSLALNQCAREEFRIMDEIKSMLRGILAIAEKEKGPDLAAMEAYRDRAEAKAERLRAYLGQIGDDSLGSVDVRWKFILFDNIQEMSAVSMLIHRDFADSVTREAKSGAPMAAEDRQDVAKMVRKTLERMERATSILMSQDLAQAEAFIAEKEQMSNSCREAQRLHLERQAAAASGASSSDYIDQLNCLRRINSHITSVAYALARPRSAALEASRTAPPPA